MSKFNALDILQECINELEATTKEQFDNKRKTLGIYNKTYNCKDYINEDIDILFDLDEVDNLHVENFEAVYKFEDTNLVQVEYDEDEKYNLSIKINEELSDKDTMDISYKSADIYALAA